MAVGVSFRDQRARLAEALRSIEAAVPPGALGPTQRVALENLQARLREPIRLVLFGTGGAGKSTLANALLGCVVCVGRGLGEDAAAATAAAGGRDADGVVERFRFGPAERESSGLGGIVERQLPIGVLRDVEIVDTGGSARAGVRGGAFERLREAAVFGQADVILGVVSIEHPWDRGFWEAVAALDPSPLSRLVVVVQKRDRREPGEVAAIVEHAAKTAERRTRRRVPVVAVSASHALRARTGGLGNETLLHASGIADLESQIDRLLGASEPRRAQVSSAARKGLEIVAEVARRERSDRRRAARVEDVRGGVARVSDRFTAAKTTMAASGAADARSAWDELEARCREDVSGRFRRGGLVRILLWPASSAAGLAGRVDAGMARRREAMVVDGLERCRQAIGEAWDGVAAVVEQAGLAGSWPVDGTACRCLGAGPLPEGTAGPGEASAGVTGGRTDGVPSIGALVARPVESAIREIRSRLLGWGIIVVIGVAAGLAGLRFGAPEASPEWIRWVGWWVSGLGIAGFGFSLARAGGPLRQALEPGLGEAGPRACEELGQAATGAIEAASARGWADVERALAPLLASLDREGDLIRDRLEALDATAERLGRFVESSPSLIRS